ncbi:MAG: VCBS repeat-containing protein [Deltaproteobacteria bacterium]|nr:VCBS repeat-containing protein [Deltaproteobacteria bacterium]
MGDIDGDGDLDAVFANCAGRNRFCAGDGSGGFTCTDVSTDTNLGCDVALGDLNP